MNEVQPLLWIDRKQYGGLCLNILTTKDEKGLEVADKFKEECYLLPKSLQWFHQGGCLPGNARSNWHMFEFWTKDETSVLEACMNLAKEFDLDLSLEVPSRDEVFKRS